FVERLARLHDAEIDVGGDSERRQDLLGHGGVLAGHDDARSEAIVVAQTANDPQELDCLGTRAEDDGNADGRAPHSERVSGVRCASVRRACSAIVMGSNAVVMVVSSSSKRSSLAAVGIFMPGKNASSLTTSPPRKSSGCKRNDGSMPRILQSLSAE